MARISERLLVQYQKVLLQLSPCVEESPLAGSTIRNQEFNFRFLYINGKRSRSQLVRYQSALSLQ